MSENEFWEHNCRGHLLYDSRCEECVGFTGVKQHTGETGPSEIHFDITTLSTTIFESEEGCEDK